jgi:nitrogen fixation protein NifB
LKDCRAVLVSGIGETPRAILMESGIFPVEMEGFITMGLEAIYQQCDVTRLKTRRLGCGKAGGCSGQGSGCM